MDRAIISPAVTTTSAAAIDEHGVLRPLAPLPLAEGAWVGVTVSDDAATPRLRTAAARVTCLRSGVCERRVEAQNARAGLCGEQVPPFQGSRHFHPKTQASAPLRLGLSTFASLALTATGGIWLPGDAVSLKVE